MIWNHFLSSNKEFHHLFLINFNLKLMIIKFFGNINWNKVMKYCLTQVFAYFITWNKNKCDKTAQENISEYVKNIYSLK